MDSRLDQNQTEFAILILTVALQMLADGHCLFDHVVQILRNIRLQTNRFHNAQDFVSVHKANLGHTMRISQNDTLKRSKSLVHNLKR